MVEIPFEVLRVHCVFVRMINGHLAPMYELGKRAIHVDHTLLRRGLDHGADLVRKRIADERAHGVIVDEKFACWNKSPRDARDKPL